MSSCHRRCCQPAGNLKRAASTLISGRLFLVTDQCDAVNSEFVPFWAPAAWLLFVLKNANTFCDMWQLSLLKVALFCDVSQCAKVTFHEFCFAKNWITTWRKLFTKLSQVIPMIICTFEDQGRNKQTRWKREFQLLAKEKHGNKTVLVFWWQAFIQR